VTVSRRRLLVALATPTSSDRSVLAELAGLEATAVEAYQAALAGGRLDAATTGSVRRFLAHEIAHRDRVAGLLGGAGPRPATANLVAAVRKAATQKAVLAALIAVENAVVAAYYDAFGKLTDTAVLETLGEIMANEGQHLVVLRTAAGQAATPNPFEPPTAGS
jgi:Ferritin-like domain